MPRHAFDTMTPPSNALPHPTTSRFGRFYVTRELGRGTAGCVYLAHDPVIDREVAVKTFNPRASHGDKRRLEQQFINEARAAGRLSHPHIVTIYDASSEGGANWVAMEYLEGHELDRMLNSGHQFTPDEVASIAWKIADALDHAHQRGVIHRDIKPANIFMVGDEHPKLIDFGIARAPNRVAEKNADSDQPYTMMRHNALLGTPNYMSPEQAAGRPVEARTDIYSLGAVMYEMLTGRTPFQSHNTEKLLLQIASKSPPSPEEIEPRVPPALAAIVKKAMSKRPEQRYQTAAMMASDLKRYQTKQRRERKRATGPAPLTNPQASRRISLMPAAALQKLLWLVCLLPALAVAAALLLR